MLLSISYKLRIISYLPKNASTYIDLTGRTYFKFMASFFATGDERTAMVQRSIDLADLGTGLTPRSILTARVLYVGCSSSRSSYPPPN